MPVSSDFETQGRSARWDLRRSMVIPLPARSFGGLRFAARRLSSFVCYCTWKVSYRWKKCIFSSVVSVELRRASLVLGHFWRYFNANKRDKAAGKEGEKTHADLSKRVCVPWKAHNGNSLLECLCCKWYMWAAFRSIILFFSLDQGSVLLFRCVIQNQLKNVSVTSCRTAEETLIYFATLGHGLHDWRL